MVSKTVIALGIILLLVFTIAIVTLIMNTNAPLQPKIATSEGKVMAFVVPIQNAPVTVTGKIIMNVIV